MAASKEYKRLEPPNVGSTIDVVFDQINFFGAYTPKDKAGKVGDPDPSKTVVCFSCGVVMVLDVPVKEIRQIINSRK